MSNEPRLVIGNGGLLPIKANILTLVDLRGFKLSKKDRAILDARDRFEKGEDVGNDWEDIEERVYRSETHGALLIYPMVRNKGGASISKADVVIYDSVLTRLNKENAEREGGGVIEQVVLIVDALFSTDAKRLFDTLSSKAKIQTVLSVDEIRAAPVRHVSYRPHYRLNAKEKAEYLEDIDSSRGDIRVLANSITMEDPIVKWNGWVPGDIIRVTRDQSNAAAIVPITYGYRKVISARAPKKKK